MKFAYVHEVSLSLVTLLHIYAEALVFTGISLGLSQAKYSNKVTPMCIYPLIFDGLDRPTMCLLTLSCQKEHYP